MTNCHAGGFGFKVVKLAFMNVTVLKMAKKVTSLKVKVFDIFFTSLDAKSNRKLSKVTHYYYFVRPTSQHWL